MFDPSDESSIVTFACLWNNVRIIDRALSASTALLQQVGRQRDYSVEDVWSQNLEHMRPGRKTTCSANFNLTPRLVQETEDRGSGLLHGCMAWSRSAPLARSISGAIVSMPGPFSIIISFMPMNYDGTDYCLFLWPLMRPISLRNMNHSNH